MPQRKPFAGTQQGLVLAIDVGTTYSGCSFSVLDPGVVPEIKGVTRFPAQAPGGSSKIPSVLYYDSAGKVRAVGAETLLDTVIEQAEDEQWTKVEWFKLHLRPKSSKTPLRIHQQILSLPPDKTFIEETLLPDGRSFWESVKDRIVFVLSHPNGWEGRQQSSMRRAAVLAGLAPDSPEGQNRILFVTEGEASLHFCINNGLTVQEDEGIIIVDAGGGTIDLSAYSVSNTDTNAFEEISRSECCFAGSIFVTKESRVYFEDKLQGTRFEEDVPRITECFDQTTKLQFRDSDEPSYVKFGGLRDREPNLDIRSGQMKIPGTIVARFFQPSVNAMLKAVVEQRREARKAITTVLLVGGFAASPFMFTKLKDDLGQLGLSIHRPDTHVNKAVADGGVSFYLDHFVSSRVARYSYGIKCSKIYQTSNPEHRRRGFHNSIAGTFQVENCFSLILQKGVQITELQEFRNPFVYYSYHRLQSMTETILEYRGIDKDPSWIDVDCNMYSTACIVTADTSKISATLVPRRNPTGYEYFQLNFDVVLLFGLTELKAQIAWQENGVEKRFVLSLSSTV
ncbi:protein [Lentinula edodes]|uniref:Protein n=1 Tax=Lentinula edodes TaxID=5353 RepID=A0A1Q3DZ15_LENED|nr:protein [Lentinula edodes]